MNQAENLIINGTGSYPGGDYQKVSIRGEGTIANDVNCSAFHVYGTGETLENIRAGSVKIMGEAEFKGNIAADKTLVMGSMTVDRQAKLTKMKILGELSVGEHLSGDTADIKGSLTVDGDVEYESFVSSGAFEIKGLLTAEAIKLSLSFSTSKAEEIGGGKITVKRGAWLIPFTNIPLSKKEGFLSAKTIEGDEIYLENTTAEVVRGNVVKIGPGCHIGLVEYSTELKQSADSTIKESIKR
ncbi:cytoplasmic protein [Neobacillus muris]|uniref:cytoplasmic protein n=1 Tax=Neobacillus muris TaxID=2941334 RepID=UPI00203D8D3F|nr:cytoplasmic protein [Neobacillus muris]